MKCPNCNSFSLYYSPIVKYRDTGGWKIIGEEVWCTRRLCDYQEEL